MLLPGHQFLELLASPCCSVADSGSGANVWFNEAVIQDVLGGCSTDSAKLLKWDFVDMNRFRSRSLFVSITMFFSVSRLKEFSSSPVSSGYESQKEMPSQQPGFWMRGQASERSPQVECEREPRNAGIISPTEFEFLKRLWEIRAK